MSGEHGVPLSRCRGHWLPVAPADPCRDCTNGRWFPEDTAARLVDLDDPKVRDRILDGLSAGGLYDYSPDRANEQKLADAILAALKAGGA